MLTWTWIKVALTLVYYETCNSHTKTDTRSRLHEESRYHVLVNISMSTPSKALDIFLDLNQ